MEGVNKSDEIRAMLKADPTMPAKKAVEALAEKGVTVSLPLVNKIKYAKTDATPKAIGGKRGRPKKAKETGDLAPALKLNVTASENAGLSAADLVKAKQLVESFGGHARLKLALDVLEQLK